MNYLAYTFAVSPPQPGSEILIAHLCELGFESFDLNEQGFTAYINANTISGFDSKDYQFGDFTYQFSIQKLEQKNWNQEWEKNFEPVSVGQSLYIRAPFHQSPPGYSHEIVIMPKMSFGTGHHQTTRLMCEALFKHDLKNRSILDMGCGTGILAILSKQLGAREVVGIDIDSWSVENSLENCKTNGFADIRILRGDVDSLRHEGMFDGVLANINKNVLKSDLHEYVKHMNPGAFLLLSGFFVTDQDELKILAQNYGLQYTGNKNEEDWALLMFKKP